MSQFKYLQSIGFLLLLMVFANSCANYKMNYDTSVKEWKDVEPPKDSVVTHSVYLIGDTGNAYEGQNVFKYLKKVLTDAPEESTIVFLGDNIYPVGMPPKSVTTYRRIAEDKLDAQLAALENFKGRVLFVPGNHDWFRYGLDGIQRQEKYIEKKVAKMQNLDEDREEEVFLPNNGCNDPEVIEINDRLVIVAIDSQWWLEDWDKYPEINSDCDIRNRETFLYYFEETLRKHRTKNVIVAMHHPIFSNGSHGGFLTLKDHLFPLSQYNKSWLVPIPLIGSIGYFLRKGGTTKQDLSHPLYKDLRFGVLGSATKNGNYIFAAGHEHNLQYWEKEGQHFIVSGSGTKENPVRIGDGGLFGYAKKGYARADFYEDGSAWINYYAPDYEGESAELVFRWKMKGKLEIIEEKEEAESEIKAFDETIKSVTTTPITTPVNKVGPLSKPIAGEHYRGVYLEQYEFPTLDLTTFDGGVQPVKMGGGRQTNSLRLEREDGRLYNMRGLTKDATRLLPYPLNNVTFAQYLAEDVFLSTHPFGSLVIPPLADAVKVYHTNPKFYYVPKQPALKEYNAFFGDEVYLIEERADEDRSDIASFGNSKDIISTPKMVEKLSQNIRHKVAQDWVVRARLFDLVIGDWDRHDDQWRWATFDVGTDGDVESYRPIPRDRDQVFPNYDGLLVGIARLSQPILKQLSPYEPNIKSIKWAVFNARHFDNSFMNELEWKDWEKEVRFIQENLTDTVIDSAFASTDYSHRSDVLQFQEIADVMKKRRDNLMNFARRFYELNSKQVDIVGTNDKELFTVKRMGDSLTMVQVYDPKLDTIAYERVFENNVTKEIHLYGLEDDDQFVISGKGEDGIKIRVIGGLGEDEIVDHSSVKGVNRKTLYYDFLSEDTKMKSDFGELKDMRSASIERNSYDRKHPQYDFNFTRPFPIVGFNPDDGISFGLNLLTKIYEFKKSPYGQLHEINASYLNALKVVDFEYTGEFLQTVKEWDIVFNGRAHGDRFAFNYFGDGNDSSNPVQDNLDFNRVRQGLFSGELSLRKRFLYDAGSFSIGTFLERTHLDNTDNRFINSLDLEEEFFEPRRYTGVNAALKFKSVDNDFSPKRGAEFNLFNSLQFNLDDEDRNFNRFGTNLSMYFPFGKSLKFVFATRIGTELNMSSGEVDFFKRPFLGGNTNLRGFRAERFRGDATFFHNSDIRMDLFESINRVLPFSMGLHAGFDHGRVWLKGENSDRWHYSYGGGFWLAPANFIVVSAGVYRSEEQLRALVHVGHLF